MNITFAAVQQWVLSNLVPLVQEIFISIKHYCTYSLGECYCAMNHSSTCPDKWTSIQTHEVKSLTASTGMNKLWNRLPECFAGANCWHRAHWLLHARDDWLWPSQGHKGKPSSWLDFNFGLIWVELDAKPSNRQALSSPNPIPVVVMSSENEPQRISRWNSSPFPTLIILCKADAVIYANESRFCSLTMFCAWF